MESGEASQRIPSSPQAFAQQFFAAERAVDAVKAKHDDEVLTSPLPNYTQSDPSSPPTSIPRMAATLTYAPRTYESTSSHSGKMYPHSVRLPPISTLSDWDESSETRRQQRQASIAQGYNRLGENAGREQRPHTPLSHSSLQTVPHQRTAEGMGLVANVMTPSSRSSSPSSSSPSEARRTPSSLQMQNYRNDRASPSGVTGRRIPAPLSATVSTVSEMDMPPTPSAGVQSQRTDTFLSSLMRAAQSQPGRHSGGNGSSSQPHSPMSVHNIVEKRKADGEQPTAASTMQRPRKRRTSSVQEPLQGSVLDAASRISGMPRRSEPSSLSVTGRGLPPPPNNGYWGSYTHSASVATSPTASLTSYSRDSVLAPAPRPLVDTSRSYGQVAQRVQPSSLTSPTRVSVGPNTPPVLQGSWPDSGYSSRSMERPSSSGSIRLGSSFGSSTRRPSVRIPSGNDPSLDSSMVAAAQWSSEIAAQATAEEERWSQTSLAQRRQIVSKSIWDARNSIRGDLEYWPPAQSNVTTIRCMYANIAQKSYGSEKRFLCPPPAVKISGPLRPCRWAMVRVVSGEAPTLSLPSVSAFGSSTALPSAGSNAASSGGEETAMIDANGEARFGKLHVGGLSDAINKVFRLQVNLLRAEADGARGPMLSPSLVSPPASQPMATTAWSTVHTSPINVISKPARKSVRTRAASPAIASGSIVCLYNRLNSQTVRTKYLGVDAPAEEGIATARSGISRSLVARQEGWEGFAIELLARPLNDPAVARAKSRGLPSDDWGITYGSIICLRDVNTNLCSDPMLICKVDKGRVELSSVVGGGDESKVRFQITHRNRQEARDILFGGARSYPGSAQHSTKTTPAMSQDGFHQHGSPYSRFNTRDGSEDGSSISSPLLPTSASNVDANSMVGGPVIQMQKVTLMHISPQPFFEGADEVECDLSLPRSYLSSTASENAHETPSKAAMARSSLCMQSRAEEMLQGSWHSTPSDAAIAAAANTFSADGSMASIPTGFAQASAVGYARPPLITSSAAASRGGQVDALEDQFCWTIVTISCTETSYIEANAISRSTYPHLPSTSLPVTPFPTLASPFVYDPRTHAVGSTIHDFVYTDELDFDAGAGRLASISATQPGGVKVAHEVWLGHDCVLATHATSAGPHMSDVTCRLPPMEALLAIHDELHRDSSMGGRSATPHSRTSTMIRIPILFVRVAQGISFPSGRWLVAERLQGGAHGYRSILDPLSWSFRVA